MQDLIRNLILMTSNNYPYLPCIGSQGFFDYMFDNGLISKWHEQLLLTHPFRFSCCENDNFNITYLVPRYQLGGEYYWNLSYGVNLYDPDDPARVRKMGVEDYATWYNYQDSMIWVEETPGGGATFVCEMPYR